MRLPSKGNPRITGRGRHDLLKRGDSAAGGALTGEQFAGSAAKPAPRKGYGEQEPRAPGRLRRPVLSGLPHSSPGSSQGFPGVFYEKTTFVEYLRTSLRSGGLMGLERTEYIGDAANTLAYLGRPIRESMDIERAVKQVEEALTYLRQNLLPI